MGIGWNQNEWDNVEQTIPFTNKELAMIRLWATILRSYGFKDTQIIENKIEEFYKQEVDKKII